MMRKLFFLRDRFRTAVEDNALCHDNGKLKIIKKQRYLLAFISHSFSFLLIEKLYIYALLFLFYFSFSLLSIVSFITFI